MHLRALENEDTLNPDNKITVKPQDRSMDKQSRGITDNAAGQMDSVDRQLLDIIQTNFPLASRPYAELGQRLGIPEEEALERVRALRSRKIIRRLGANFQSAKLASCPRSARPRCPRTSWTPLLPRSTPSPA